MSDEPLSEPTVVPFVAPDRAPGVSDSSKVPQVFGIATGGPGNENDQDEQVWYGTLSTALERQPDPLLQGVHHLRLSTAHDARSVP